MATTERFRQPISGALDLESLQKRLQEGWKLVAFEWERPATAEPGEAGPRVEQFPYGSQLSADAAALEENRVEMDVLSHMMELIVEEVPYSYIADELNRAGFRTRTGRRWSSVSVFEMLPRLIDVGPAILTSPQWRSRRRGGTRVENPSS